MGNGFHPQDPEVWRGKVGEALERINKNVTILFEKIDKQQKVCGAQILAFSTQTQATKDKVKSMEDGIQEARESAKEANRNVFKVSLAAMILIIGGIISLFFKR